LAGTIWVFSNEEIHTKPCHRNARAHRGHNSMAQHAERPRAATAAGTATECAPLAKGNTRKAGDRQSKSRHGRMAKVRLLCRVIAARTRLAFLAARARTRRSSDRAMKISKTEARYGRGTQNEHCGKSFPDDKNFCRHFIEPGYPTSQTGTCTEVSGSIGRVYWCKLWRKAHEKRPADWRAPRPGLLVLSRPLDLF
jgi:hypothetical protein